MANRRYFGLEPLRLRDATDRVLARVVGIPPERATVGLDAIAQDFRLGTAANRTVVDEMVRNGLLERLSPSGMEYEIAAIAVFGSYMSLDEDLPDVSIGVTGRRRPPTPLPASGPATQPTEGTEQLRALFEQQSAYLRVSFFRRLQDVPRPFSVTFSDAG